MIDWLIASVNRLLSRGRATRSVLLGVSGKTRSKVTHKFFLNCILVLCSLVHIWMFIGVIGLLRPQPPATSWRVFRQIAIGPIMAVTLRYFTEFGQPGFQPRRSVHGRIYHGRIYGRVYCILQCVYDVVVKKVHVRYLISWWVSCLNYHCTECNQNLSNHVTSYSKCVELCYQNDAVSAPSVISVSLQNVCYNIMWAASQ